MVLQPQAEMMGIASNHSSYLLALLGIANTLGRIVLGFISDKPWINRLLVYNMSLTICGIGECYLIPAPLPLQTNKKTKVTLSFINCQPLKSYRATAAELHLASIFLIIYCGLRYSGIDIRAQYTLINTVYLNTYEVTDDTECFVTNQSTVF